MDNYKLVGANVRLNIGSDITKEKECISLINDFFKRKLSAFYDLGISYWPSGMEPFAFLRWEGYSAARHCFDGADMIGMALNCVFGEITAEGNDAYVRFGIYPDMTVYITSLLVQYGILSIKDIHIHNRLIKDYKVLPAADGWSFNENGVFRMDEAS